MTSTPTAGGSGATSPPDPHPADLVAAAALACPAVARLHGGRFGEVATYLPGRRVVGIRIGPTTVDLHLVGRYPTAVADLDAAVRAAVDPHLGGRTLTVAVEDYALDEETS